MAGTIRKTNAWPLRLLLALVLAAQAGVSGAQTPRAAARQILDTAGVQGGLVAHLGCGDGQLTAALQANDRYRVHGLDTGAENVRLARKHIQGLGIYGKVSVESLHGKTLPYADNLVNLLVASKPGEVPMAEMMRVVSPDGVVMLADGDGWKKIVKPRPQEIDDWTHYLHDPSNNAVADDTVVGPPRRYQWIAGPRWARSHDHLSSLSAMVSTGGRVFYIIDEGPIAAVAIEPKWFLVARDAFSGVLLWKRPVAPWEGHLRDFRSGPADLARRLVAVGDRVYVTLGYGKPVSALDAATGETVKEYKETTGAMEILVHDNMLLAVVGDRAPDNTGGAAKPVNPANSWHWWPIYEDVPPRKHLIALHADSGKVAWKKDDAEAAEIMPTTLAAAGKRVFFQSHKEVLALDGSSGNVLWRAARPVACDRPTWSAPTLVVHGDVVLCGDRAVESSPPGVPETTKPSRWVVSSTGGIAPKGQIIAFATATGEKLWESDGRECYNAPVDVLVADDMVWSGNLVHSRDPGISTGRDVHTGEIVKTRPPDQQFFKIIMSHHRCHRNKATVKYLVLGRDGIELIDLATGKGFGNSWVRGSCQYGVMPCNGLIYAPHHSCACHVESKLNNFNALAPAAKAGEPIPGADQPRLQRGPAYSLSSPAGKAAEGDWPTYRHDAARSGRSSCAVPVTLKKAWETEMSGDRLSCPVIADGKVFVARIDRHEVCALDSDNGKLLWSFTAGGRVDSPPTIHGGTAIFGCADGWIYCVRVSDGQLAWRFRAAPGQRRIVSYDQLESAWPVHGSVLVPQGVIHAVAGRTTYLDGGMVLCRLDASTGKLLSETPITGAALPDVLSSDGTSVFLRHRRFDEQGAEQQGNVSHLYSPAGFLDGSWWHRTYWQVGTAMRSGWGAWPNSGNQVPAGRLLVVDNDSTVYGFGRFNQYHRHGTHVGLGRVRYFLYASAPKTEKKPGQPPRRTGAAPAGVPSRWSESLPLLVRGMVLCEGTLFVAGPPDVVKYAPESATDPYHSNSPEALREQEAALAGKRGGLLWAVSADDGTKLAEYPLEAPPQWDGLAAAGGRLYLTTTDGKILCMENAK